ncbi:hypothetical protein Q3G72_024149 [Acer saccharum]|nr:hypothetical protein Q3G72_024149 [Acer saccharum]
MNVLARRKVQRLDLKLLSETPMVVPRCIVNCESLVDLKICFYRCCVLKLPEFSGFTSLKSLNLCMVEFSDSVLLAKFVSSCPVLESLIMHNCNFLNFKILDITASRLRNLTINVLAFCGDGLNCEVIVACPSLVSQSFSTFEESRILMNNVLKGICNVKALKLSPAFLEWDGWSDSMKMPNEDILCLTYHLRKIELIHVVAQHPPVSNLAVDSSIGVENYGTAKRPRADSETFGRNDVSGDLGNGFNKNRNERSEKNFGNVNLNGRKSNGVDNRTGLGNSHRLENDVRIGNGKVGRFEKNGSARNNAGPDKSNSRKSDRVDHKIGLGNTKKMDIGSGRPSRSRFDILSDEGEVTMAEGGVETIHNSDKVKKYKESVVLLEVTNQKNIQGQKAIRTLSQSSKNVSKKPFSIPYMVTSHGGTTTLEAESEAMDSATVLRQLHNDVSNFEAHPPDLNKVLDCPMQPTSSNSGMNVDNFDSVVASKLEEAMVVISE